MYTRSEPNPTQLHHFQTIRPLVPCNPTPDSSIIDGVTKVEAGGDLLEGYGGGRLVHDNSDLDEVIGRSHEVVRAA